MEKDQSCWIVSANINPVLILKVTATQNTGIWDFTFQGNLGMICWKLDVVCRKILKFRLDFFAYENGKKSGATMGLATVGGVCLDKYACVIAEFGTTNVFGKPYPSAGFTSVYILAHEIGHK